MNNASSQPYIPSTHNPRQNYDNGLFPHNRPVRVPNQMATYNDHLTNPSQVHDYTHSRPGDAAARLQQQRGVGSRFAQLGEQNMSNGYSRGAAYPSSSPGYLGTGTSNRPTGENFNSRAYPSGPEYTRLQFSRENVRQNGRARQLENGVLFEPNAPREPMQRKNKWDIDDEVQPRHKSLMNRQEVTRGFLNSRSKQKRGLWDREKLCKLGLCNIGNTCFM